jgi:uncharacterized protein YbjT (DUF2867 family)
MILIVGATGELGGTVTRKLLSQGRTVRVLARPNSDHESLRKAGAEIVLGDLKDRASLDAACRGIETVITTANSARRGGDDNPQTVDLEGNRRLIDAAKAAGVAQFIFISAMAADANSPVPFLKAKGQAEEYLRASGVPFTIVAPNAFMEVWPVMLVGAPARAGQPVTLVGEGRRRHSFISAADVANFIIAAIGNPHAMGKRLILGGPEPLSFRDTVTIYERALGRSIPVRSVAPGQPIPGVPEAAWGIAAGLEMYDSPIDMTDTARTFGVRLTPLTDVVNRELGRQSS